MTGLRLYEELADWWPLLSRPADYAEEATIYRHAIEATSGRPVAEVLEIGSGGGNNASHLKTCYRMTLADIAPAMLAVSRRLNPECEHVQGDMRTLRLERTFDAVFIHDAIGYLTTEDDLRAALATAHAQCRPGGVALFVPDATRESFRPQTASGGHDGEDRALRYLEWTFDPDPEDTQYVTLMAYALREGLEPVRVVHDEHRMGLFGEATWLRLIREVGFEPRTLPFPHSQLDPDSACGLFLGRRPP